MIVNLPIAEKEIDSRIKNLAFEISHFFKERGVDCINTLIVLVGAFVFASDLLRELSKLGLKILTDVIQVESYKGTKSGGFKINKNSFLSIKLNGKNVLVIDDILDTGKTLNKIKELILKNFIPNMIEFCCLLRKDIPSRNTGFSVRFVGFDIPNQFVVGYGLDYNGKYRELPFITDISKLLM